MISTPEPLFELAYASRRAPGLSDDQVIEGIVMPASRRNRELEITGCLWFDAANFVQILEGPRSRVEKVYDSISRDPRHFDIDLLVQREIAARNFERWGLKWLTGKSDESIESIINRYRPARAPASAVTRARTWLMSIILP